MNDSKRIPREEYEDRETRVLQGHGTESTCPRSTCRVFPQEDDDFRTPFQRDYTRIIQETVS